VLVTDKLKSYAAAKREIMPGGESRGLRSRLKTGRDATNARPPLQSVAGLTFGLLLVEVRNWCREQQIRPAKFTYKLGSGSREICVEFQLGAEADAFALTFPRGAQLQSCPDPDFSI
jgi:hypothetical protein